MLKLCWGKIRCFGSIPVLKPVRAGLKCTSSCVLKVTDNVLIMFINLEAVIDGDPIKEDVTNYVLRRVSVLNLIIQR